jgi:hypothetical protein
VKLAFVSEGGEEFVGVNVFSVDAIETVGNDEMSAIRDGFFVE